MEPFNHIKGDCLVELPKLPEKTFQLCVTSPPYLGLRDYKIPPSVWPEVTFVPMAGLPPVTIQPMTCCQFPAMSRNQRSVWRITTEPFKGAHFATFPSEIPRRAIMAGTSARGCCADCGTPWGRTTEQVKPTERPSVNQTTGWQPTCECHGKLVRGKISIPARASAEDVSQWGADQNGEYLGQSTKGHSENGVQDASAIKQRIIQNATQDREVTGWIYTSDLPIEQHPARPCQVLDPFLGSGTTAQVALELGRHVTGIELADHYHEFIDQRTTNLTIGLPL